MSHYHAISLKLRTLLNKNPIKLITPINATIQTLFSQSSPKYRLLIIIAILLAVVLVITTRIVYLDTAERDFLKTQSKHQSLHHQTIGAFRG